MLSLTDCASVSRALSDTALNLDLRALIGLRAWQLHVEQGRPIGTGFRLITVEGGDTPEAINAAVGFDITGDQAEPPVYDWIADHGLWFEIAIGTGDDALTRILVENGPATELGLHYLCLTESRPDAGERQG